MIITIEKGQGQFDIKTNQDNTIYEVLKILIDRGLLTLQEVPDRVYSARKKRYMETKNTFHKAGIYQGDILRVNE